MVRSFGWLLLAGIGVAFALALTAGFAALGLRREDDEGDDASRAGGEGGGVENGATAPPAGPSPLTGPAAGAPCLVLPLLTRGRVLGIGLALAVLGWGLGTQIDTQSDIRALVPQNLREVRDLNELQDATGVPAKS